ncbi:hypothetical protein BHM03_00060582, partial [Ensete ventricosum]
MRGNAVRHTRHDGRRCALAIIPVENNGRFESSLGTHNANGDDERVAIDRCGGGSDRSAAMPKKMGVNTKAEAARARQSAVEEERKDRAAKDKEERYWRDAEGSKSRAAKKREDEAGKRAEAAARRAENRKLAEQEQRELEVAGRKPDRKAARVSVPVPKVTEAELQRRREEERQRILQNAEAAKKRQNRTADEEEYDRMVMVENTNRDDSVIDAHSVEDAIARMALSEPALPPDRHPERRLKVSFKHIAGIIDGSLYSR